MLVSRRPDGTYIDARRPSHQQGLRAILAAHTNAKRPGAGDWAVCTGPCMALDVLTGGPTHMIPFSGKKSDPFTTKQAFRVEGARGAVLQMRRPRLRAEQLPAAARRLQGPGCGIWGRRPYQGGRCDG